MQRKLTVLGFGLSYTCNIDMTFVSAGKPKNIRTVVANLTTVPVQNYITAIIVFLIVEQLMTWGFYGQSFIIS